MTNTLLSTLRRVTVGGLAVAALTVAAPAGAATAKTIDPAVYDAGVPAGMIEHGTSELTITGSRNAQHDIVEFWIARTGWRSVTREAATRSLVSEAFGDSSSTHSYQPLAKAGTQLVDIALPSPPPLPGWTAAYNQHLLQRGALQATGPQTVAGLQGTVYELAPDPASQADGAQTRTEVVLEDGTDAPLMRQTSIAKPGGGQAVQREELTSRETRAAGAKELASLSKDAAARRERYWVAQIRAAHKHHARRHAG